MTEVRPIQQSLFAVMLLVLALPSRGGGQTTEQDWLAKGFEKVEIHRIEAGEFEVAKTPVEFTLPVSFIRLAGSNWTHDRLIRHVSRTATIFSACSIGLGPIEVIEARVPGGRHDLEMENEQGLPPPADVMKLSAMTPDAAYRPPVFFVGRLHGDEALARSFRRGEVPSEEASRYAYLDTSWIAFKTHWIERNDEEYSTVAHELAHLLCECGHNRAKKRNLLNRYRNFLSSAILPETCEQMRRSPLLERVSTASHK